MSLSIFLCSDLGSSGAGSLELKIAYALWEAVKANLTFSPQLLSSLSFVVDSRRVSSKPK